MRDPDAAPPPAVEGMETPPGMISADRALQVILILLTIWTAFSGLALVFFPDNAEATIGGGQSKEAQRLLGVHVLAIAPIYGLLAWNRERYRMLLWLPYAVQTGVVVVAAVNIVSGTGFWDGALPLVVAATFLTMLVFIWRAGRLEIAPDSELLSRFTSPRQEAGPEATLGPEAEASDGSAEEAPPPEQEEEQPEG